MLADSAAPLGLRATVALAMFPHGTRMGLGWFGGGGWESKLEACSKWLIVPRPLAALFVLLVLLGPPLLPLGLGVRALALASVGLMIGAITLVNGEAVCSMNWGGIEGRSEALKCHLIVIGACLAMLLLGPGRWINALRRMVA
jgi:uncharacterized membrane protein YphA (DoxX/SURF4 family)